MRLWHRFWSVVSFAGLPFVLLAGCTSKPPQSAAAAGGAQAMPVMVQPVTLNSVPSTDTYVSTVKSLRSATLQPQVDGNLTKILVKSGDQVKAGQLMMQIDPLKQVATVEAQQAASDIVPFSPKRSRSLKSHGS